MRHSLLTLTLCLCLSSSVIFAQAAPAPAAPAAAAPILEQIPDGAMGFMVVTKVGPASVQVDKFLQQIGLGEDMKQAAPNGLLEMIKMAAMLGEGFNPNGGFAAVMLDPQQFGIDIGAMIFGGGRGPDGQEVKLPFVLIVPGSDIDSVFGQYERTKPEGSKYTQVALRMGPMMATSRNGYVLLSPLDKALDAMLEAKTHAATAVKADEVKLVNDSVAAIHLDMKIAGPIISKMIKQGEDMMAAMRMMAGPQAKQTASVEATTVILQFYREMIGQLDTVTYGAQVRPAGAVLDVRVGMRKDSELAQSVTAMKSLQADRMNLLPNMSYVLALDSMTRGMTESDQKMLDRLLCAAKMLNDDQRARLKKIQQELSTQVTSMQLVVGQAPEGKGNVGVAAVMQVKDAAKVKGLLADGVALATELSAATKPAPATTEEAAPPAEPEVKLAYKKDAQQISGLSVDAIEVTPTKEMTEKERADLKKALGDEDGIRVLVASPAADTIVLTLGGGSDMMTQALKANSDKSGNIMESGKEIVAELPKERTAVMLLNLGNLFDLIRKFEPADENLPAITTRKPVAISIGAKDTTLQEFILVPTDVIKEIVESAKKAQQRESTESGEAQPATEKKAEDF